MAQPFKNFQDIEKYLKGKINKVLENEVAETVRKVQQRNIDHTVYDATEPHVYDRRKWDGGLIDGRNIVSELTADGVLEITNVTKPNKRYKNSLSADADLPLLIEYGDGHSDMHYTWERADGTDHEFKQSRPFTKNTVEELQSKNQHVTSLKFALKKQGLDVK